MTDTLSVAAIIFLVHLVFVALIYLNYRKDCRHFGKENLAVSFRERLITYLIMFVLPTLLVFAKEK